MSIPDLPTATPCNPLLVPELFQCILDCFPIPKGDRPSRARKDRRALAALAQTCHALSEPALDRLWRRLDSFAPLIRCFAPSVDADRVKTPPSAAEWTIITRYSHRVWELTLESLVDAWFLESASSFSQSPFLLPNLRVLRWSVSPNHRDLDLTSIMHRLLCPSLVSLSATLDQTDCGIQSFLQNYSLLCPGLKSVEFNIFESGKVSRLDIHQLSQAICTHEDLECLKLSTPIDDVALRHVILSPKLRVVSLVFCPKEPKLGNINLTPSDTPLRNVKKLELGVWDLNFIHSLLRPRDQTFHTLHLRLHARPKAKYIFAFLTTLVSPQRMDSLRSIYLAGTSEPRHWYPSEQEILRPCDNVMHYRLTYDTLHPLTSLKHLRELGINLDNQTFLTDEELADLARSWPMLEVLDFDCGAGYYEPSISLRGLLSLLAICPRLRELGLSLDAREVPEKTGVDVCNTILTSLQLSNSSIRDAHLVAEFLSRHLPSVTYVYATFAPIPFPPDSPHLEEYGWLWDKVNNYL